MTDKLREKDRANLDSYNISIDFSLHLVDSEVGK